MSNVNGLVCDSEKPLTKEQTAFALGIYRNMISMAEAHFHGTIYLCGEVQEHEFCDYTTYCARCGVYK